MSKRPSIDKDFIKEGAEKVTQDDIKKVTDRADDIKGKFSRGGPLGRFLADVELLLSMISDYWSGRYTKLPYWVIAAVVFALLYVLNPVDLIPDFIPVVGYVDDAAVVAACLFLVEQELHEHKRWKGAQGPNTPPSAPSCAASS